MLKNISKLNGAHPMSIADLKSINAGKAAPNGCNPTPEECAFALDCPAPGVWDWECCKCVLQ